MTPADLKAARRRLSLTQWQMAARLGVDWRTYVRWENGETHRIPGPVIAAVQCWLKGI